METGSIIRRLSYIDWILKFYMDTGPVIRRLLSISMWPGVAGTSRFTGWLLAREQSRRALWPRRRRSESWQLQRFRHFLPLDGTSSRVTAQKRHVGVRAPFERLWTYLTSDPFRQLSNGRPAFKRAKRRRAGSPFRENGKPNHVPVSREIPITRQPFTVPLIVRGTFKSSNFVTRRFWTRFYLQNTRNRSLSRRRTTRTHSDYETPCTKRSNSTSGDYFTLSFSRSCGERTTAEQQRFSIVFRNATSMAVSLSLSVHAPSICLPPRTRVFTCFHLLVLHSSAQRPREKTRRAWVHPCNRPSRAYRFSSSPPDFHVTDVAFVGLLKVRPMSPGHRTPHM